MSIHHLISASGTISLDDGQHAQYSSHFVKGQFYEHDFLRYISMLRLAGAYLDIGTNIGNHICFYAANCPAQKIIGFEPIPAYRDIALANIKRNEFENVSSVLWLAVGNENNEVEIEFGGRRALVPQSPLDQVDLQLDGLPITLVKIDVEGFEPRVLEGARRTLTVHKPVIFVEVIQDQDSDQPGSDDIDALLEPLGYVSTGRIFNYQPTLEYVHQDNLQGHITLENFALENLKATNSRAQLSNIEKNAIRVELFQNEATWLVNSATDFGICEAEDSDLQLSGVVEAFIHLEAFAEDEAKLFFIVNTYAGGLLIGQTKTYINRRGTVAVPRCADADCARLFLNVARGSAVIRKILASLRYNGSK